MQISVAMRKHINFEYVGFINGRCIQLCVRMCDKYRFSHAYRQVLRTNSTTHTHTLMNELSDEHSHWLYLWLASRLILHLHGALCLFFSMFS